MSKNLIITTNGQEAWDKIERFVNEGSLKDNVKLVITDIEMPRMDGHHLTKLIKSNGKTSFLPVIIFSSMISEDMMRSIITQTLEAN